MPQPTNLSNKSKKKIAASSGRIPAYNNAFAFRHNPKSKKTASILASPIQYCCRRCHEKLVWRKTYRKYKPLTQPTTCNLCKKRNITAAYHTVCDSCSVSHPKALALLQEWNDNKMSHKGRNIASAAIGTTEVAGMSSSVSIDSSSAHDGDLTTSFQNTTTTVMGVDESLSQQQVREDMLEDDDDVKCSASKTATSTRRSHLVHKRVCTVCFKQPALPDDDGENANDEDGWDDDNDKPLKLRQLKSIQRQREKQLQQKVDQRSGKKDSNADATVEIKDDNDFEDESDNDDDDNEEEDDYDDDEQGNYHHTEMGRCDDDRCDGSQQIPTGILDLTQDDDVDDPFLQAIGGVQNLLVGEAYQKKLLEKNTKRP